MDFVFGLVIGLLVGGSEPSKPLDPQIAVWLSCGVVVVGVLVFFAMVRAMRRSL